VEWLNRTCQLKVHVAQAGDKLQAGRILVAPSFAHLYIKPDGTIGLNANRDDFLHMPSGDVMFQSLAEVFGEYSMGIILTGMGSDGANGLLAMRRTGSITIAQDQESCVVFGMPKEAIVRGAAQYIVSLPKIGKVMAGLAMNRQHPESQADS
jgi:two-component system, chemotaxis family, protein-glutamate methylesterase/glutaminase